VGLYYNAKVLAHLSYLKEAPTLYADCGRLFAMTTSWS